MKDNGTGKGIRYAGGCHIEDATGDEEAKLNTEGSNTNSTDGHAEQTAVGYVCKRGEAVPQDVSSFSLFSPLP